MKTFMQYLEGLFDPKFHRNPLLHGDFIDSMSKSFPMFPLNLLTPYIRLKLDGKDKEANDYRVDLMVAGKSYAKLNELDKIIMAEIKKKADDSTWWNDPSQARTSFGQK
jgi:hypothetical protein